MNLCIFSGRFLEYLLPRIDFAYKKYMQLFYKDIPHLWVVIYIYLQIDPLYELSRMCLVRHINGPSHLLVYQTTPENTFKVKYFNRITVLHCFRNVIDLETFPTRIARYLEVYDELTQIQTKVIRMHRDKILVNHKEFDFSYEVDCIDDLYADKFEFSKLIHMS
jgi:hypothetical protein